MKKYYITFILAGIQKDSDKVFLQPKNRTKHYNHKNDYETVLRIPDDYFKQHFFYDRRAGIYRTIVTYADIKHFTTIYDVSHMCQKIEINLLKE